MDDANALATSAVAMICFAGIGLIFASVIGGAILQGICAVINSAVGRETVPIPSYLRAVGISAATIVLPSLINAVMLKLATGSWLGEPGRMDLRHVLVNLAAIAVDLMIMAALLSAMLPTTIPKALLVVLLEIVIAVFVIVFIGFSLGLALGMLRHAL